MGDIELAFNQVEICLDTRKPEMQSIPKGVVMLVVVVGMPRDRKGLIGGIGMP